MRKKVVQRAHRVLCWVMAVALTTLMMPVGAFAAEPNGGEPSTTLQAGVADFGFTTQDVQEVDLSGALKEGSSLALTSTDSSAWTAADGDGRSYIQSSTNDANASVTIESANGGWLIFDWGFVGAGNWKDKFTVTATGDTTSSTNIGANSSSNQGKWVTKVVPVNAGTTTVTWTAANSDGALTTAAWLGEVRFVEEQTAVTALSDDSTEAEAKVGSTVTTAVDPGSSVTFSAESINGAIFAGWKASADSDEIVKTTASFTVTVYDDPVSYYAFSERPFEGSGTEAEPFLIKTTEDLEAVAKAVEGGTTFAGKFLKLENDIDAEGAEFAGIGASSTYSFAGAFDGADNTISNIKLTGRGLFNNTSSTSTIKDLTVDGDLVASANNAGMVAGTFSGTMTNVTSKGTITSDKEKIGGLVGSLGGESTVENCSSEVAMAVSYDGNTQPIAGGIVGEASYRTKISNCTFTGSIDGTVDGVAKASGIGGILGKSGSDTTVSDCTVTANVAGKARIGGIVGFTDASKLTVTNCEYSGDVSGTTNVGGVVGYLNGPWSSGSNNPLVSGSTASGTVKASEGYAGGIVGYADRASEISNCTAKQTSIDGTDAARITTLGTRVDDLTLSGNKALATILVNEEAIPADDETAAGDKINGESYSEAQAHTVTFDPGEGAKLAEGSAETVEVQDGEAVAKPADPVWGSTNKTILFKGWYNGDEEYDFSSPVTEDITLTGVWWQKRTLTFNFKLVTDKTSIFNQELVSYKLTDVTAGTECEIVPTYTKLAGQLKYAGTDMTHAYSLEVEVPEGYELQTAGPIAVEAGVFNVDSTNKATTVNIVETPKIDISTGKVSKGVDPTYGYTGNPVKPSGLRVLLDGAQLKEGTDYELSYLDAEGNECEPVEKGSYKVVVAGIGGYTGQIEVPFEIVDFLTVYVQPEGGERTAAKTYATLAELQAIASDGDPVSAVFNSGPHQVSTAATYVTLADLLDDAGAADKWRAGSTVSYGRSTFPYEQVESDSWFFPNAAASNADATGKVAVPMVLALTEYSGKTSDTLSAADVAAANVEAANAKNAPRVIVGTSEADWAAQSGTSFAGQRLWSNVSEITITYGKVDISTGKVSKGVDPTYGYTGNPVKPSGLRVLLDGAQLKEGTDYELSYLDAEGNECEPVEKGSYKVVVAGIGGYTGQIEVPFEIVDFLTVYVQPEGGERTAAKTYATLAELQAIASDGDPVSAVFNSGPHQVSTAATYVTLADLLDDAGAADKWRAGSTVSYGRSTFPYEQVESDSWFFPNAAASNADATGKVAVPMVLALTEYSGKTSDTLSAADVAAANVEAANAKNAPRVIVGTSEADWAAQSGTSFAGQRLWSNVSEITITYGKVDISNADVSGIEDKTYNGSEQTQSPVVKLNGVELVNGTDYEVTYKENVNAGSATMTVTGVEKYSGSVDKTFTIAPAKVDKPVAATNLVYNGKTQIGVPGNAKYYTVKNGSATNAGSYTATATCVSSNYVFTDGKSTASVPWKIAQASVKTAAVTVNPASYTWTGKALKPAVTVKLGTTTLKKGTDYTVAYSANTAVGTAKATVTGKGNYKDSASKTYVIAPVKVAKPTAKSFTYDGKAKTGVVAATGYTLSGTAKATAAGTYKATAKLKAGYAWKDGTTKAVTLAWKIGAASVAKASVASIGTQAYTAKAVNPAPAVKLGATTLKKGTDYDLVYYNASKKAISAGSVKAAGTYYVAAKGKGNYSGTTALKQFKVVAPSAAYRTHVQTYGWQSYVKDGASAGTTGQSKRLEAMNVKLAAAPVSGSIEYRTHIQTYGWEKTWKKDGQMSGTSGESKRLEAMQVRLTGEMAKKYDVYYRVHAQHFGWMGWAKNGQSAGTAGFSYRLEAMQIKIVPKGAAAPGSTANCFRQK